MPGMEITALIGCKISCAYCPQDKIIKAYTERSNIRRMSFDVFKTCIDKIPPNVDIHFSGLGEPWLNSDCTKMLLYAHKEGHKIEVFTTLVGMSLSDIDLLESIPFKRFFVHLPSSDGYEKIKVNENYLELLSKISQSNIKIEYQINGETVHSKLKSLIEKKIDRWGRFTRAGNVKINNKFIQRRKRGIIGCRRNLCQNVLLPNGDVTLCCMDFGMRHVLGNLISFDYDSLFRSEEFLKVKKGLINGSLDILCRYCEYSYDVSLFAKVYNIRLSYMRHKLKNVRSLKDFFRLAQKVILKLF